ncbi:MAG: FtsX-like permease family protein [Hyphomicrobium sp.]|uniref:ABC transporter permease n=1 Tax=Hyphomicrobium sp. TaxID=82 RepID=UPI0039E441F7
MTALMGIEGSLRPRRASVSTIVRLGLRELRNGFDGFRIFIACLALGVMVIAAVGALADALRAGLVTQGETLLGGDVTFARMHIRATPEDIDVFRGLGRVSETATMRTMARRADGADQALAELKGVDGSYPLAGAATVKGGASFADALSGNGAIVDAMLLDRLGLKVGDPLRIGETDLVVKGILDSEPDAIVDRLTYGPRVFVSLATLEKTALVKPGTLIRWRYAIKLPSGVPADRTALADLRRTVGEKLPAGGYTSADRYDPSPQISRALERLRQFLILIGLASLLVGGVGIANAVSTFIDRRMKVIATLRSVGASAAQIMQIFLVQLVVMSAIGIAIGLALGVVVPSVIDALYGDLLPVRINVEVSAQSLLLAALYGLIVALLFALWPLGRAENVPATVLFRDSVSTAAGRPRKSLMALMGVLAAALVAIAISTSEPRSIALYILGGLVVMLAVFGWLGGAIGKLARRLPRTSRPELGLALRNIASPDGLTRSVVLSLGTGLTLLVVVALANAALVADLQDRLPAEAPDYFLLDIPPGDFQGLNARIVKDAPGASVVEAPMLRGRIVAVKGTPVEELKFPSDAQWVLNGDRGLTYADAIPEGSTITAGSWWGKDYDGPPLVSFEGEIAKKLGLGLGDEVTINVLGRNITAKVASLRDVKWESIALNFIMVFSPNALRAAPHNLVATVRLPKGTAAGVETEMVRDIGRSYPSVSAIRVRDAIDQFSRIFEKVMVAVRVAGSVTLTAGALVLAGAMVTAQRRRIQEAVILKTIGARRRQILGAHAWEYALLAAIAAVVAILLGAAIAWVAVTRVMELDYVFDLNAVFVTLGVAAAMIAVFGGFGTWRILRAPAVTYLRSE